MRRGFAVAAGAPRCAAKENSGINAATPSADNPARNSRLVADVMDIAAPDRRLPTTGGRRKPGAGSPIRMRTEQPVPPVACCRPT